MLAGTGVRLSAGAVAVSGVPGAQEPEARSAILCHRAEVLGSGGPGAATVQRQWRLPPNPANVQHGFGIVPGSYALGLFLQPFYDSGATEYLSINPFLLKLTREWIPALARQNPDQ